MSSSCRPSAALVKYALDEDARPVESTVRKRIEKHLGHDFGNIRIHAGLHASLSAHLLQADAYAIGNHVVMDRRSYNPLSAAGEQLLTHELAHTMQQEVSSPITPGSLKILPPDHPAEQEAKQAATAPLEAESSIVSNIHTGLVARQEWATAQDVTLYTEDELETEYVLTSHWLSQHSVVERDYEPVEAYRALLEGEIIRRGSFEIFYAPASRPETPAVTPGIRTGGITASSLIQGYDASVRINQYVQPAEQLAKQVLNDVQSGKIPHLEGRTTAHQTRNDLLTATRKELSPGGKAFSEAIKEEGKSLPELVTKYSRKILSESPALMEHYGLKTLDPKSPLFNAAKYNQAMRELADSAAVSEEIIKAAGRTGKVVTAVAKVSKVAGPIGVGLGAAISAYEVVDAPEGEKLYVAGREASGFAGGMIGGVAGGLAAGWTASLLCGPGAPVCALVVSVAVVGAASYGGSVAVEKGYESAVKEGPKTDWSGESSYGFEYWDFCWLAREVIPDQWRDARRFIIHEAPRWFRSLYAHYGKDAAQYVHHRPLVKALLRPMFLRFAVRGRNLLYPNTNPIN